MFIILDSSHDDYMALEAVGTLSSTDYDGLLPKIEAIIAKHDKIQLLVDLEKFDGWEIAAAWKDMMFGFVHWSDISRMAIIGDAAWESWAAQISNVLMPAQVRHFHVNEREQAHQWMIA